LSSARPSVALACELGGDAGVDARFALTPLRQFLSERLDVAGFAIVDWPAPDAPKPRVYLEYGTHDELFPFEHVALPMRASLEQTGCDVTFSVDEGGRHWPSGRFSGEALDWFLGAA